MSGEVALRAALIVAAIAAALVVLRRRTRAAVEPPAITLVARAPLGRGVGLALVDSDGRRLLVGWGQAGVRLVHDLGPRGAR